MIRENGGAELKVSSQTRFAQHICFNIKENLFLFLAQDDGQKHLV
jgi:hypothetical protein